MKYLMRLLVSAASIYIIAYLMEGIHVTTFQVTLIAAAILGLVNTFVRPVVKFFTLPITIMTLGLFTLVINGAVLMAIAYVVEGFEVRGFMDALLGAVLISIANMIMSSILGVKKK